MSDEFLSTPSVRRATRDHKTTGGSKIFLSTPSVRRATKGRTQRSNARNISIHALREEGDLSRLNF